MHVKAFVTFLALVGVTANAGPAGACSTRPYAVVSDYLEMAADASQADDFALAVAYADRAVDAASQMRGGIAHCARIAADVQHRVMVRREAIVEREGRSAAALHEAAAVKPEWPSTFNCD